MKMSKRMLALLPAIALVAAACGSSDSSDSVFWLTSLGRVELQKPNRGSRLMTGFGLVLA